MTISTFARFAERGPRAGHPQPTRPLRRRRAGRGRARRALSAAGAARLPRAAAVPRAQPPGVTAHAIVQRSLPRGRGGRRRRDEGLIPAARRSGAGAGAPGYVYVRRRVVRQALEAGLPLRRRAWPKRAQFPPLLPQVWGLRLFPRSGGADELALDQRLSALSGARARGLCAARPRAARRRRGVRGARRGGRRRRAGGPRGSGRRGDARPGSSNPPSSTPARSRRGPPI